MGLSRIPFFLKILRNSLIQKENNNLKTKIEFLEEENKKLLSENNRFIESRSIGGKN